MTAPTTTALYVTPECSMCGLSDTLPVTAEELDALRKWKNREMFIQDALPNRSADERELVKTGTHPACWDAMMGAFLDADDENESLLN